MYTILRYKKQHRRGKLSRKTKKALKNAYSRGIYPKLSGKTVLVSQSRLVQTEADLTFIPMVPFDLCDALIESEKALV